MTSTIRSTRFWSRKERAVCAPPSTRRLDIPRAARSSSSSSQRDAVGAGLGLAGDELAAGGPEAGCRSGIAEHGEGGRRLPRRAHQPGRQARAQARVEHEAQRRAAFEARQPAGQRWIVLQDRARADEDGVVPRPQEMRLSVGDGTGDGDLAAAVAPDHAVARDRELQRHFRALARQPGEIARHRLARFRREQARHHGDAGGAQNGVAAAADARIGIARRRDDAGDAGPHQRFGARGRAAVMGAGLERHIGGGADGAVAGLGERDRLGMRPSARRGDAAPDDHRPVAVVAHDQRADRRVGAGQADMALRPSDISPIFAASPKPARLSILISPKRCAQRSPACTSIQPPS